METKDVNWPKVSDAKLSRQSLINLTAWYCCFLSDDEGFAEQIKFFEILVDSRRRFS